MYLIVHSVVLYLKNNFKVEKPAVFHFMCFFCALLPLGVQCTPHGVRCRILPSNLHAKGENFKFGAHQKTDPTGSVFFAASLPLAVAAYGFG